MPASTQPSMAPDTATQTPHVPPPTYLHNISGFTVVRVILGLLLLTTALLKMSGGPAASDIMRSVLPFVSPRLYSAGILFESILGFWLLSGLAPAWSWLCSIGFFALLSYMSSQLGIIGQASCGCFGKVQINPWWAFAADLIALLCLCRWRPAAIVTGLAQGISAGAGAAAIVVVVGGGLLTYYGSLGSALAHMQGETIVVDAGVVDAGPGKLGEFVKVNVTLTNYNEIPVRIVGGTSDCTCVSTDDLPIELGANESKTISVRVKYTGSAGQFRRKFSLFTSQPNLRVMPVALTGRVVEK